MKKQLVIGLAIAMALTSTIAKADGEYCREYTKNVNIGGKIQQAYGTACQLPDGTWKIMSEDGQYTNENINIIDYQPQRNNTYVTNSYYYDDDYYPRPRSTSLFSISFGNSGLWRSGRWCPTRFDNRWGHHHGSYAFNNGWHGHGHNSIHGRGRWHR